MNELLSKLEWIDKHPVIRLWMKEGTGGFVISDRGILEIKLNLPKNNSEN